MKTGINSKRNYGIDLFKMFSMYLVVILHVLGQGGVLDSCEFLSINYVIAWCLDLIAYCAVDCFALTSGYLCVFSKFKPSRLIKLWFTVVFYSVLMTSIFIIASDIPLSLSLIMKSLFPVLNDRYWYFTAYAAMFLFIPILNFVLNNLDKKTLTFSILVIFLLFCILSVIANDDVFYIKNGYSFIWLSFLYIIGGYCRKYDIAKNVKKYKLVIIAVCCSLFTCGGKIISDIIRKKYYLKAMSTQSINVDNISDFPELNGSYKNVFANYTFPTVVIFSVLLLILFSRIKINNSFIKQQLTKFSPLVFSVYLIHTNPMVWDYLLSGLFESFAGFNTALMIVSVISVALLIFMVCIMIDMLRYELFNLLRINKLCNSISNKLAGLFDKCYNKFFKEEISVK